MEFLQISHQCRGSCMIFAFTRILFFLMFSKKMMIEQEQVQQLQQQNFPRSSRPCGKIIHGETPGGERGHGLRHVWCVRCAPECMTFCDTVATTSSADLRGVRPKRSLAQPTRRPPAIWCNLRWETFTKQTKNSRP